MYDFGHRPHTCRRLRCPVQLVVSMSTNPTSLPTTHTHTHTRVQHSRVAIAQHTVAHGYCTIRMHRPWYFTDTSTREWCLLPARVSDHAPRRRKRVSSQAERTRENMKRIKHGQRWHEARKVCTSDTAVIALAYAHAVARWCDGETCVNSDTALTDSQTPNGTSAPVLRSGKSKYGDFEIKNDF